MSNPIFCWMLPYISFKFWPMIDTDDKKNPENFMVIAFMAVELLVFKVLLIFVFPAQNPTFWIYVLHNTFWTNGPISWNLELGVFLWEKTKINIKITSNAP